MTHPQQSSKADLPPQAVRVRFWRQAFDECGRENHEAVCERYVALCDKWVREHSS